MKERVLYFPHYLKTDEENNIIYTFTNKEKHQESETKNIRAYYNRNKPQDYTIKTSYKLGSRTFIVIFKPEF